jgi:predicted transport protein
MTKLMKENYGVSHGFANLIALLYREQEAGGAPVKDDLVSSQYTGSKEGLRPIYDAIIDVLRTFGDDVEIAPKKNYVSLRRSKQFAIIQPSTKTRIDLGLNLKEYPPTERLEAGNIFNGMCTHRVQLESVHDLDEEVILWLRIAYEQS